MVTNDILFTETGVIGECPMCGEWTKWYLLKQERENLMLCKNRGMLIQDALPDREPAERELCMSGFCLCCQQKLFGGPNAKQRRELKAKNRAYKKLVAEEAQNEKTAS